MCIGLAALVSLLLVGVISVEAGPVGTGSSNSIGFVDADGSVNIRAVRQSGYQRHLDIDGFDLVAARLRANRCCGRRELEAPPITRMTFTGSTPTILGPGTAFSTSLMTMMQ